VKAGEIRFLQHVAEQEVHWTGACTSTRFPRRYAESLRESGLLDTVMLRICDGDGWALQPERERIGYCLTAAGVATLARRGQTNFDQTYVNAITNPAMDPAKRARWIEWARASAEHGAEAKS
jgi:hypothetical protein